MFPIFTICFIIFLLIWNYKIRKSNSQQQNLDTTNSNNDEITRSDDGMENTLRDGIERANKVNGLNLVLDYHKIDIEQIGHPGNFGLKYNVEGGRDHEDDVLDSKRDD